MQTKSIGLFLVLAVWINAMAAPLSGLKEAEDRRDVGAAAIQEALSSKKVQQRVLVAQALGRIQKPECVDFLLALLRDSKDEVRGAAAFSLGQLGWDPSMTSGRENEIAQILLTQMAKEKTIKVQAVFLEAIGKLGLKETPSMVLRFLKDPSGLLREQALLALFRYRLILKLRSTKGPVEDLSDEVIKAALLNANHPEANVRRALVYYFARNKDIRGLEDLKRRTRDSSAEIRMFALIGLQKIAAPSQMDPAVVSSVLERIYPLTKDLDHWTKYAALQTAHAWGGFAKGLKSVVCEAESSPFIRAACAKVLSTGADPEFVRLEKLLLDSNPWVSTEALKVWVLQKNLASELIIKKLEEFSKSPSWVLRLGAVEASAALKDPERIWFLEKRIQDSDIRVRAAVLEAAASLEDAKAFGWIEKALGSEELAERGSALTSLTSRKEPKVLAISFLTYQRSMASKWIEAREELVKFWSGLVNEETTGFLKTAAADSAPSVATLARKELKARGVLETFAPIEDVFSASPYREMRFQKRPRVVLEIEHQEIGATRSRKSKIELELFSDLAPIHAANMVGLIRSHQYDGLLVHRVVPSFVIQGGDPDQTGWGSAGYSVRAEVNSSPFLRGAVGMPRSTGFDTGGTQYFINHIRTPHLDGQYTVFGKVVKGLEKLERITIGDRVIRAWVKSPNTASP